jgi:ubiquinone/menaquinone biosynthesis C-methylase UbiE
MMNIQHSTLDIGTIPPMTPNPDYVLGHSQRELQRLALQAEYWNDATLELLQRAGITTGMRVLDLGCGGGDVCLLAASVVGPSGSVVGVDRSAEAIETARRRTAAAGVTNVQYQLASIEAFLDSDTFDAMIGRFILMYSADPATGLERLLTLVKPGGIVAFLEMDMVAARTVPPVAFVATVVDWLRETFRRGGVQIDLASQVWRIFQTAGLMDPAMIVRSKVEAAPAPSATVYVAETVRSLLPMMERLGVATAAEVDIDTLAGRLQHALDEHQASMLSPLVVGTWSRVRSTSDD